MTWLFGRLFDNCSVASLFGTFPGAQNALSQLQEIGFSLASHHARLSDALGKSKRNAIVVLCGIGSERGFLVFDDDGEATEVADEWWRMNGRTRLHVLACTCHSYGYLTNGSVNRFVSGAIGYEGELWIDLDPGPLRLFVSLLYDMRRACVSEGEINRAAYERCIGVLSGALAPSRVGRVKRKPRVESWFDQIWVERQRQRLRLLNGGQL